MKLLKTSTYNKLIDEIDELKYQLENERAAYKSLHAAIIEDNETVFYYTKAAHKIKLELDGMMWLGDAEVNEDNKFRKA